MYRFIIHYPNYPGLCYLLLLSLCVRSYVTLETDNVEVKICVISPFRLKPNITADGNKL